MADTVRVSLVLLFAEGDDPPAAPTVPHATLGFMGYRAW